MSEQPQETEAGAADPAEAGAPADRERLARQLRDTRLQLAMTQARLDALEQSATMGLGRVVVNAAKRPWPRGALLPRDLYRLWRERSGGKEGATLAARLASAQLNDLAGAGERFLSALTTPGRPELADPALTLAGQPDPTARLVITGVLSAQACATLAPDAVVHPLLPHDADVVLESTGADLVLIEAAAMGAGSPWAYATDPAAADRGRRLARLIVLARSLGKPVVLVRNVPASAMPGLGWVASSCDLVWDAGLGVQLARFNPIGVPALRPVQPVYAGGRDAREPAALRLALDDLTGDGTVELTGPRSWRALPGLYRSHAVFVAGSPEQAREQQACGARVAGPSRELVLAAREAGPPSPVELRAVLREIFAAEATPARLAAIAAAAGLPAGLVAGRQIAVIATVSSAAEAATLAASMLRQRLRPAEVIVSSSGEITSALAGLGDHGIEVRAVDNERGRALPQLASSAWVTPVRAGYEYGDTYLADLACARECSQADVVGFGAADYEFSRTVQPALARRELLGADAPPVSTWGSHGLRLFSLAAPPDATEATRS